MKRHRLEKAYKICSIVGGDKQADWPRVKHLRRLDLWPTIERVPDKKIVQK
jgi:hypothetical protein